MQPFGKEKRMKAILASARTAPTPFREFEQARRFVDPTNAASLSVLRGKRRSMMRVTRQSWTPEQPELLLSLVEKGVSALLASAS
jgi:hypothetical protein